MTIRDLWQDSIQRFASLPSLGFVGAEPWTYADLNQKIQSLQKILKNRGLVEGDRVALYAPNQPAWGMAYLAITTASLVAVPLLTDFHPREVAYALNHSEARILVVGSALKEAWDRWVTENPLDLPGLEVLVLEDLAASPGEGFESPLFAPPQEDTLAAILYTSGTTGASKAVMLTHGNLSSNAVAAAPIPKVKKGECCLSVLPLAHTFECTLGLLIPLHLGARVYYLNKPPSATVLLPALAEVRPHFMLTVPLFIEKIYRQKIQPSLETGPVAHLMKVPLVGRLLVLIAGAKLKKTFGGRIKFFGIGGAPLAPEVEGFLKKGRFPYAIGYGLTETSPLLAGSLKGRVFSTGPVLRGVSLKISDERNGQGAGEILVKGPNVTPGYFKDPERTRDAFTGDGYFRTGDLGVMGKKGHLFIKGRLKNLILGPNGENIYPEAIEALINKNQLVAESLVIQRGQDLIAKVVLNYEAVQKAVRHWAVRQGKDLSAWGHDASQFISEYLNELRREINQELSRFSKLHFMEEQKEPFEKTATLKIKRYLYA